MEKIKAPHLRRRENNLVFRIKSKYPHLYGDLSGRYIRKVLRATDRDLLSGLAPTAQESFLKEPFRSANN
jgi:hypothetical protein